MCDDGNVMMVPLREDKLSTPHYKDSPETKGLYAYILVTSGVYLQIYIENLDGKSVAFNVNNKVRSIISESTNRKTFLKRYPQMISFER